MVLERDDDNPREKPIKVHVGYIVQILSIIVTIHFVNIPLNISQRNIATSRKPPLGIKATPKRAPGHPVVKSTIMFSTLVTLLGSSYMSPRDV